MELDSNLPEGILEAIGFAAIYHKDQTYNCKPYVDAHLIPVYKEVCNWVHAPSPVHVAAILHDVLEDTRATKLDIEKLFGVYVSELVWRLTDEPGVNRKERKAKTYPKIREDSNAVLIKLCDRLINMRAGGKLDMYRKEYPEFKAALYIDGEYEDLWNELDLLAVP